MVYLYISELDIIKSFLEQDYTSIVLSIFLIMAAVIAMFTIVSKFSEIIGKPFKWIQNKDSDHTLLLTTSKQVYDLQADNKQINTKIEKLTDMVLDKQIDDMRFEILDFTSAISNGRKYNREAYDHILRTYKKYEQILTDNHMENGLVEESVKFIQEVYHEKLKNSEFS
jgi:hypothetical protein